MEQIVKNLMLFNGSVASVAEWKIIFKGCGCPCANKYFWMAMRDNCLFLVRRGYYLLKGVTPEVFEKVLDQYRSNIKACNQRVVNKKKAIRRVQERANKMSQTRHTIINGCVAVFDDYDFD